MRTAAEESGPQDYKISSTVREAQKGMRDPTGRVQRQDQRERSEVKDAM